MDLKEIKRLIELVEDAKISHFSIEEGGMKIRIEKELTVTNGVQNIVVSTPVSGQPTSQAPVAVSVPINDEDDLIPIKAQMVGTFYSSPKPDSPMFVKVGDYISKGQPLCVIEAMKLFNEIESEVEGTLEKVCIKNGEPVEYGQVLFLLKP